jgi:peptide/nickel transport system permease protein
MTGFVVRRMVSAVLVVILASMFVFTIFYEGMGNSPAVNYCTSLKGVCTPEKLASIEHQMGYDQSLVHNYGEWARGIFLGRTTSTATASSTTAPHRAWASRSPPANRSRPASRSGIPRP